MELVLFFGGVTLAILIICGILPFGALGIGICIACSFICASHFLYTNSWTCRHNYKYLQKQMGFSKSKYMPDSSWRRACIKLVLVVAGFVFGILGVTGIINLGLLSAIYLPMLVCSASPIVVGIIERNHRNWLFLDQFFSKVDSNNLWIAIVVATGVVDGVVFGILGLTGVISFATAIALAAPLVCVGALFGLFVIVVLCIAKLKPSVFKNSYTIEVKDEDDQKIVGKRAVDFLGLNFTVKCDEIQLDDKSSKRDHTQK